MTAVFFWGCNVCVCVLFFTFYNKKNKVLYKPFVSH